MDRRHRSRASRTGLVLTVGAMSLALVAAAGAQSVGTSSSGTGNVVISRGPAPLPISDDAVRSMIATHLPALLQAGSEDNYVLLVVDADDQYVSAKASKATTLSPGEGPVVVRLATGDSVAAGSVVIRSAGERVAQLATVASSFFLRSGDSTAVGDASGVMGTGIKLSDVATIGLKRFAAGDLSDVQIVVAVIKLK